MTVTFFKHNKPNNTSVYTRLEFFSSPVAYKLNENCLIFKHVGLDYRGRVYNFSKYKGFYQGAINESIPCGKYQIDEESNEDQIIIYLD